MSEAKFNTYVFPSGLRLLLVPMKSTKTVTVLTVVGTGSKYETRDINGISHFLEHMMFKGTKKRPAALDISQELDSIGAEYNAFTTKEYTGYYAKASAENTDMLIDIIADVFLNSKFDEKEIEKEKGVIVEEINMYLDTPMRHVGDMFEELLYGDQPAGWNIAGKKEIVTSLKRDDFVNYFNSHYVAKNTIVAVAGDIDTSEVYKKIESLFKDIRDSVNVEKLKVEEKQEKPGVQLMYKKTDQTHFHLGVRAFDMFDERLEVLDVLAVILGGGMSSRLFSSVRERQGLAYYIRSSVDAYTDSGYLVSMAGVDNTRVMRAIETIMEEYRHIRDEAVPEEELKKAKQYIHGKVSVGLESSDAWANFYADQWLLKNEILTPEEKLAKIDTVTVQDIQDVAREIFKPEKLNLALIGPFEKKEEFEKLLVL